MKIEDRFTTLEKCFVSLETAIKQDERPPVLPLRKEPVCPLQWEVFFYCFTWNL